MGTRNDTRAANDERKLRIPKHEASEFTRLSSAGAEEPFDTGTPIVKTFTFGIQRTSPPEATELSQGEKQRAHPHRLERALGLPRF